LLHWFPVCMNIITDYCSLQCKVNENLCNALVVNNNKKLRNHLIGYLLSASCTLTIAYNYPLDKIIKLHRILLLLAHWIKLQIYFCVTPLENQNDTPGCHDEQFENHGSTGCELCSTGVITMQYLLLTFRECMQTLFLSKQARNKIKALTHCISENFQSGT